MTGHHLRRRVALRTAMGAMAPEAARLELALRDSEGAQARLRRQIGEQLSRTDYGRAHGVTGPGDFERLPVVDYDTLRPWIERQREEEGTVLCAEPVRFYERTSGSGGAAKYVPYTASLRRGVSRMFAAWVHDLLRHAPKLSTGKTYISVSPRLGAAEVTDQGLRVGLDDDAAYLDGWLQRLVRPFFVGPSSGERFEDGEAFKDAVARSLLLEPELEVVSVWNPSFFEVILDHVETHRERLARELPVGRRGVLSRPDVDWSVVWPMLKIVSCWDQGPATPMAARLRRRLPHGLLQGKGLLATEGPVTVPWTRAEGCVPLVHTTVVELLTGYGDVIPLYAGRVGESYEIVISPLGGLPRYRLGDRVEITHRYRGAPCLRFVGRAGGVSDLVGEKLQERFVESTLASVLPPSDGLRTLVPMSGPPGRYVLLSDEPLPEGTAEAIDEALSRAHHYGLARALGQLAPADVVVAPEAARWIAEREVRRGLRWGDVKPRHLQLQPADSALERLLCSCGRG